MMVITMDLYYLRMGVTNTYDDSSYSTDVFKDKALQFIQNNIASEQPFLLVFTPTAPHGQGVPLGAPVPAVRHQGTCDDIPEFRPPSFNEEDVSDKPTAVKDLALLDSTTIASLDAFRRNQICSLKAVDEAVDEILNALGSELDNTVVIFTSDNGFMLGEHRKTLKDCPYEECIRVPLAVRYPPLITAGSESHKFVLNIDIAPTLAELGGATATSLVNGRSFVPLFTNTNLETWREFFLFENKNAIFGIRTENYKYTEYNNGDKEFYPISNDPDELVNDVTNPTWATEISNLKNNLNSLKLE